MARGGADDLRAAPAAVDAVCRRRGPRVDRHRTRRSHHPSRATTGRCTSSRDRGDRAYRHRAGRPHRTASLAAAPVSSRLSPSRPELLGNFGMVTSTHWLASQAGMAMLEAGGTAADAAAACGFVLQVVEPHMCGPGGDLPVLVGEPGGDVHVVAAQGPAPSAATIAEFRRRGLDSIPGHGLLSAVVPGAFGGWMTLV